MPSLAWSRVKEITPGDETKALKKQKSKARATKTLSGIYTEQGENTSF